VVSFLARRRSTADSPRADLRPLFLGPHGGHPLDATTSGVRGRCVARPLSDRPPHRSAVPHVLVAPGRPATRSGMTIRSASSRTSTASNARSPAASAAPSNVYARRMDNRRCRLLGGGTDDQAPVEEFDPVGGLAEREVLRLGPGTRVRLVYGHAHRRVTSRRKPHKPALSTTGQRIHVDRDGKRRPRRESPPGPQRRHDPSSNGR